MRESITRIGKNEVAGVRGRLLLALLTLAFAANPAVAYSGTAEESIPSLLSGLGNGNAIIGVSANADLSRCEFASISREDGAFLVEEQNVPFAKDGNSEGATSSSKSYADLKDAEVAAAKLLHGKQVVRSLTVEETASAFQYAGECEIDVYNSNGTNTAQSVDKDGNVSGVTEFK